MSLTPFVNAHTHLYAGLMPFGLADARPADAGFMEVLAGFWWRMDRALDAETLRAAARVYLADAIRHGTAAIFDHHESPNFIGGSLDVLAEACEEAGMPAVLCYGASERNGGRAEARRGLAENERFLEENEREFVRGAVGLHASFTVSDATIREAAEMAREYGTVLHVHLAEDNADLFDAGERGFRGPLARFEELGAIVPGSIFAHGVHLSDDEVRRVRDAGCWLVHNPRSNLANGVGYARALSFSDRVALGTDGFPSRPADEVEELLRQGAAHEDDQSALERRAGAGIELAEEFFDFPQGIPLPPGSGESLAELEAAARAAAERVRSSMRGL